jgi:hypothetical protein
VRKVDYNGKLCNAIPVEFEAGTEPWVIYKIADGTTFKIRLSVTEFIRIENEFQPNGEPAYMFTHALHTITLGPDELQKHAQEIKDKKKVQ